MYWYIDKTVMIKEIITKRPKGLSDIESYNVFI